MRKIGIMGGTFDPVHQAHIILAAQAKEQYLLDEIWFMPSKHPPHKLSREIASDEHRVRMLELALDGMEGFLVSDFELKRDGITYSSDTFELLDTVYPEDEFYLIMGGDSILQFETWHEPQKITEHAAIIASSRAGLDNSIILNHIEKLADRFGADIFFLDAPGMNVSSHDVRERISLGMSVSGLLSSSVEQYIKSERLYRDEELEAIHEIIRKELKPSRYMHTIGVAVTAAILAGEHGADIRKAYLAGLLHDNAKAIEPDKQFETAVSLKLELTEYERKKPAALVHAKLGEYYARTRFGIKDEDILNAIFYHTTGRPNMSLLEKIIFIADYIEPGREMKTKPSLAVIRSTAHENIDKAVYYELYNTISYLESLGEEIDSFSRETMDFYRRFI